MSPEEFLKALRFCRDTLGLTASDLSHLTGCNRGTVEAWLRKGTYPNSVKRDQIAEVFVRIWKAKDSFPVPLSVTQFARKGYVLGAVNAQLPQSDTADGRS